MNEEEKGFVIKDRRVFSEDGPDRDEKDREAEPSGEATQAQEPEDASKPEKPGETSQLPEINFATFIFSLNSSVLVHLGMIEDPATGKKEKNLPIAKQTIDILGMLEEKTKGNLLRTKPVC